MKLSHKKIRWLLVPALLVGGIGSTLAYRLAVAHWEFGQTTMFIGVPGGASGQTYADALRDGMNRWNEATPFKFYADANFRNPCAGYNGFEGNGDLQNGVGFSSDVCGSPFDNSALAVTLTRWRNTSSGDSYLLESDIVFNSKYSWDIYDGPLRGPQDFRRVALHELGHALGLEHELTNEAIMRPQVSALTTLTADDIAGANALYAPGAAQTCSTTNLALNARVSGSLSAIDDCQMRAMFGGSDDSLLDRYQVRVPSARPLYLHVKATGFEPVLLTTTLDRQVIDTLEVTSGCEVKAASTPLPEGSYYLLVNTYDQARPCGSGQGQYELTISDSPLPVLGPARTFASASAPAGILFQAGAAIPGQDYASFFAASDSIDVSGRIVVAPAHEGTQGSIYVVAVLDDGRSFMKNAAGDFVTFSGRQQDLRPAQQQFLSSAPVGVEVIRNFRADLAGLSGHTFHIFIGYSALTSPGVVYYPNGPLSFQVAP
jgi:hypothetical protein